MLQSCALAISMQANTRGHRSANCLEAAQISNSHLTILALDKQLLCRCKVASSGFPELKCCQQIVFKWLTTSASCLYRKQSVVQHHSVCTPQSEPSSGLAVS